MEERYEEELKLAQEMKASLCNKSGKETDAAKSGEIIHQLGKIYRKQSPDKISLIQSAGLFNAAIVRNPLNISQIKSDLCEICQHILQKAEAKQPNADLIKKAKQVKTTITKMRNDVKKQLSSRVPIILTTTSAEKVQKLELQKITTIKKLNKMIAYTYKSVMKDLSQFCQEVMGKPPCKYAVVGMGSLARQEITPYSDFEHIILLFDDIDDKKYEEYLEYFRWYSVLFHVVILNLGETIIPSLNIFSLNDKHSLLGDWFYDAITPRGVSFDGMMSHASKFPLGRVKYTKAKQFSTELIKPVSEMLKYLGSKADLKNGYHLADILTKTCYVFGNIDIFNQFANGVQNYRDQTPKSDIFHEIENQVKEDLNKFSTRFRLTNLQSQNSINIKQLVYRSTTIFISALARIHNISANSCFKIVKKLAKKSKITQNTAKKLLYTTAIACEMRLRYYAENNCQSDEAIDLKAFLNIVKIPSTVSYFQIAYCLQFEIAKQLHYTELHFFSDPQLINIAICLALEIPSTPKYSENLKQPLWDANRFDFDNCIEKLQKNLKLNANNKHDNGPETSKIISKNTETTIIHAKQIIPIAQHFQLENKYKEAINFYQEFLSYYPSKAINPETADVNQQLGICLQLSDQCKEALVHLNKAQEFQTNTSKDSSKDRHLAVTLYSIGGCHKSMQQYEDALKYLNRALEIVQNTTLNADNDRHLATTLHSIGVCHESMQQYANALKYLNRALEIEQNTTLNADNDRDLANTLYSIGGCHKSMQQYEDALKYLNRALEIEQNTTLNADNDRHLATTLHSIGGCHESMQQYEDALKYLNRALEIYQNTTLNADNDRHLATTLHSIGGCHKSMQQYEDALKYLNRALEIVQNTTLNADNDRDLATTLSSISGCHKSMQQYANALKYLNRALEIDQNTTLNADNDRDLANTLYSIGGCHKSMQQYEDALKYLNRALEIVQNTTLNADNDRHLATTLHSIGVCHESMQQYEDALKYLNRALEIYQNTTLNAENDRHLATTLHSIA